MRKHGLFFYAVVPVFLAAFAAAAADDILPVVPAGEAYRIVEKHNFRRRVNGAYLGAVYREIRGVLHRTSEPSASGATVSGTEIQPGSASFEGRFFILEEAKMATRLTAARVDESVPVRLTLGPFGAAASGSPGRFPTMRDFPAIPAGPAAPGSTWQAFAERMLDPYFTGDVTPVRVYVDYRYEGPGDYRGSPGYNLKAKYAVRWKRSGGAAGDPRPDEVAGTHDVTIFLPAREGGPRVIGETFTEEYRYPDGRTVRLEGTTATFFEGVSPLDMPDIAAKFAAETPAGKETAEPGPQPAAEEPAAPDAPPDIEIGRRPEGVALTINNLRFHADTAVLLPSEMGRLESLAKALSAIPGRTILVVGHAADVGRPEGQMKLSIERARTITDALEKRGIARDRLMYQGRGGEEPAASNDTETGRARNRRVEIIILED